MTTKEPCPKCRENGEDRAGDNLARYPDGGAYCFKCKYREPPGGAKSEPREKSKLSVEQIESYPVGASPSRDISDDVASLYGVRYSVDTSTGVPNRVYYPYCDLDGTITGFKARDLIKKDFRVSGTLGGVFGKQACSGKGLLFVTEGEEDALALKEIIRGTGKSYDVVSLPDGAQLNKNVREDREFFDKYDRVYLVLDADKPGQEASVAIADWLATTVEVRVVNLPPEEGKDASDYHLSGKGSILLDAIRKAEKYEPDGIVNAKELDLDALLVPLEEGYPIPYPGLQEKLHGLRKGEIVTLCAGTGIGKSTFSRELAYSLLKQDKKVALVALEDQMDVSAKAMLALDMNLPLHTFKFHPPPKSEVQPHADEMFGKGNLFLWKHYGGIDSDIFLDKMYYYARAKSCDFIVLDHFSDVVAGSKEPNERRAIDQMMKALSKLVVETGVGIIMVVHLKRPGGDKSFSRGAEVSLDDLRGSAAIEQYSWSVIGIERDQQGEDCDFSRIRVLKNRTFGFTGLADTLKFDTTTGRLVPFVLDEEPEEELP